MTASNPDKRRQKYAQMSPEERAELLEKNRQWREQWRRDHPEEYEAQKRERAAKITEKYQQNEEFAERRREYLRKRYNELSPEERELRRQKQREAYQRRKLNKILAAELQESSSAS